MLRIDPRSGERTVLATIAPGLDNLTFAGNRLLVSSFTGQVTEILGGGQTRGVLPGGLTWPLDLTVGSDGILYVADGTYFYAPAGRRRAAGAGDALQPGLAGLHPRGDRGRPGRVRRHHLQRPGRAVEARGRRRPRC